jgi:hypothetical protein
MVRIILEKDPGPILMTIESVFPKEHKLTAKPVIQILKILGMAMTNAKSKIKRELVAMTKDLLKNKDKTFFEVF